MTDKESNDSRRKLLKSIAAGSGAVIAGLSLPESWSKPVVDSILLPVHAETTCCNIAGTYCASIVEFQSSIVIEVAADGGIVITLHTDGDFELNGSVSCAGGSFNATHVDPHHRVTGTVTCDGKSISGIVEFFDADNSYEYTATIEGCMGS